jgi:hypothetical protein
MIADTRNSRPGCVQHGAEPGDLIAVSVGSHSLRLSLGGLRGGIGPYDALLWLTGGGSRVHCRLARLVTLGLSGVDAGVGVRAGLGDSHIAVGFGGGDPCLGVRRGSTLTAPCAAPDAKASTRPRAHPKG